VVALCAIAVFIFFIIFMKAVYAFGVLGFFVFLLLFLVVLRWIMQRREQRRHDQAPS
jgi:hypothetical protein